MKEETKIYLSLSQYLQLQYPDIVFHFDIKLQSLGAGIINKRMNPINGFSDLVIFEPRGNLHGLFLEIKKDGEKLFKINGEYKTPHLKEQADFLEKMNQKGYYAKFGIGWEECIDIIKKYLG